MFFGRKNKNHPYTEDDVKMDKGAAMVFCIALMITMLLMLIGLVFF
jgi:hypothetical protein